MNRSARYIEMQSRWQQQSNINIANCMGGLEVLGGIPMSLFSRRLGIARFSHYQALLICIRFSFKNDLDIY